MPLVDRAGSVLVVVDAQPGFVAQKTMDERERAESAATLERVKWLAGIAALLNIPAIVVEEGVERAGATDPGLLDRLPPETPVLAKRTFSLAARPEIVEAIRATARDTAVLAGFETDVCVAQSAVELRDLGYRVVVPVDCAYSTGETEHRRGLNRMRQAGVELNHAKGLAFEWLRVVDDAIAAVRTSIATYGPPPLRL